MEGDSRIQIVRDVFSVEGTFELKLEKLDRKGMQKKHTRPWEQPYKGPEPGNCLEKLSVARAWCANPPSLASSKESTGFIVLPNFQDGWLARMMCEIYMTSKTN